jgi:hypothetical protein
MFTCGEGFCLSMDPSDQFGQRGLLSHLDELSDSFLKQPLNTSIPVDRVPDLLREEILDLLFLQGLDSPMVEDGEFRWTDLNMFQNILNLLP